MEENEEVSEEAVTTTLRRAMNFHSTIQAHDGHWGGDSGGPMFLLPGLVATYPCFIPLVYYFKIRSFVIWITLNLLKNIGKFTCLMQDYYQS